MKELSQLRSNKVNNVARIRQCATIRDILEHFFFSKQKKVRGTRGTGVFLGYKCWYKRIVAVPEQLFSVAQRGTNGDFIDFFAFLPWHTLRNF